MKKNKIKKRDTYKQYVFKKYFKNINIFKNKNSINNDIDSLPRSPYQSVKDAPMHIALIVDDIVEDIIHCDERFGYLLISNPLIIQLDNYNSAKINDIYEESTNTFKEHNGIG